MAWLAGSGAARVIQQNFGDQPVRIIILLCLALAGGHTQARETARPNDISDPRSGALALTGATITIDPDTVREQATLLIRQGRVVDVLTSGQEVPAGYVIMELNGRYVYPGLIDLHSGYGLPEPEKPGRFSFNQPETLNSEKKGAFNVNQAIRSEYRAADMLTADDKAASAYRKLGFSTVLSHMADGIARGSGALVTLGGDGDAESMLSSDAAAFLSFRKGSSRQSFPISIMGTASLLRQTEIDAEWYEAQSPRPFTDQSLDAWLRHRSLPQIFEVGDWNALLLADRIGDELGQQFIIRSGGDEYRRIQAVKETGAKLIVPIKFPDAPDVSNPWEARRVTLADMKHWELAPGNPGVLAEAGVQFAITSSNADKGFWKNLRKAVEHGLSESDALAALTRNPASMLGVEAQVGTLQPGSLANFLVTSKPLFEKGSVIQENWIRGQRFEMSPPAEDRSGNYQLTVGEQTFDLEITGEPAKPKAHILGPEDSKQTVQVRFDGSQVGLSFRPSSEDQVIRLSGWVSDDQWQGSGQDSDGQWLAWSAKPAAAAAEGQPDEEKKSENGKPAAADQAPPGPVTFPFMAYGWTEKPEQETLVFRDATVWTLEGDGIVENADVLVRNGRIQAVGTDLSAGSAREIDATGLHLTPGIIDEHSHIALRNVNDIATNSGMVRMEDAINSDDISIYRNLAGGVTAAQLLHGSANPIGGQSAIVKMRWGALPREMLIDGAQPRIKFALGENVKRSGNAASVRYPQTRMGVEQVFVDAFTAAQDYQRSWDAWNDLSRRERARTPAPRRDLALDAMVEVLQGERLISCHSYVQSEINMLMKVAEDFDFQVNTFTHILEGYKVADKMAAHGAAGSSFSDWWAYKWEVRYAIPYGPALMHQAGVNVAINSDSSEMSRRLNQEAAKSVKYGEVDEVEAFKMVTLNPAKMLRLDHRMGSIAEGKDADIVLWNDHPLSIYARPKMTLVDGIVYFDEAADVSSRDMIRSERARLVSKALAAKANGEKTRPAGGWAPREFHCDSIHGYEHHLAAGGLAQ